jgi:CRP-like cAMP-binding protein
VGGAIALTAICAVAVIEFGVAPMAAVTTSGVVIAVLGFAVRHMIADLFYGVTLALERPFEIGNWIKVSDGTGDETIGRVDEFTWRAVKLVTRANLKVFVPNSIIATTRLTNFDQPEPMWRNTLRITLGYDVPVSQAERVLLSAVARVPESASLPATPEARVVEYEEYGVVWELRFWVPSYEACSRVTQRIHDALLQNLKVVGLAVPRPREEVWVGSLATERSAEHLVQRNWIDRVMLVAPLPSEDRDRLQASARRVAIAPGAEVVREGEPGSSLFVLQEGALEVWKGREESREKLGTLHPGDVFGEMSLLTGAERSATVLGHMDSVAYEITKSDLEPLLNRHPTLAQKLADLLADRVKADSARDAERSAREIADERAGRSRQLLERIRTFFKLAEPTGGTAGDPQRLRQPSHSSGA